jgi:hypothetical protein
MNEGADKERVDTENNKYRFFKVANAFLLLTNLLLIIIGFHYMPTCTRPDSSYFSVIVTVLGILITVLVTWQIWQVIDTKAIISQMQKQVDIEKRKREEDYKNYSRQLSLFTFAANCANDAIMMITELHNIVNNGLSSARNNTGYNVAYGNLLRALRDAVKANTPETERLIDICLDNMHTCLDCAEKLKMQYENYAIFDANLSAECEHIYKSIKDEYPNSLNRRQGLILDKLQNRQKNLTVG